MNRIFPGLLIVAVGLLMAVQARRDSPVFNEDGRIASGVLYFN
ncbi:MAG: hypothetical protein ACOX6B_04495 [Thermoguttaceae bacterium]|jgi:hypothetical protein